MANTDVIRQCEEFISEVFKNTHYDDDLKQEAADVFSDIKDQIAAVATSSDGAKLIQKYSMLAATVSTEGTFNDMVKIVWRMVKTMTGSAEHKLVLFVLGTATVVSSLRKMGRNDVNRWSVKVIVWLGDQLTIGGKGVTGEGEGTVADRIRRFFSTPYLHDFD